MSGPSGYDRWFIDAEDLVLGDDVQIHPTATIRGYRGRARRVEIGDCVVIGENARIFVDDFRIGDYSKLNAGAYSYGRGAVSIGRNCWFGGNTILDAEGGLTIEDNCTIGAGVKIWSHFLGGDWVRGGRFNDYGPRHIGRDTWIGCDCVVTADTPRDAMYLPMTKVDRDARPVRQFDDISDEDKARRLESLKREFFERFPDYRGFTLSQFDPVSNTYEKRGTDVERMFIKMMMPRLRMVPR